MSSTISCDPSASHKNCRKVSSFLKVVAMNAVGLQVRLASVLHKNRLSSNTSGTIVAATKDIVQRQYSSTKLHKQSAKQVSANCQIGWLARDVCNFSDVLLHSSPSTYQDHIAHQQPE